jgi:signal transduction histidine kinase/ActR/RegA family two-component response regulator
MNVPATLSVVAAVIGIAVALLAWKIGAAPQFAAKRLFAFPALFASAYAVCDVFSTVDPGASLFLTLMRVQGAAATLHGATWLLYVLADLDIQRPRLRRAVIVVAAILAVLWLVPGCMVGDQIQHLEVPWLGVAYAVQTTTVLGTLTYAADSVVLVVPVVLIVRARHRVPKAMLRAAGLLVLIAFAVNDVMVAAFSLHLPFLCSLGFLILLASFGFSLTNAFVASASELDTMTKRLEQRVAERTSALLAAESALVRAEKLVAIGKLSSGVAHAINNPSAAIAANLEYLRMSLARGALPDDAKDCLDESFDAIQQVAKIVRQLLDSTRSAEPSQDGRASVRNAIEQAVASARAHIGERVIVDVDAPQVLFARADAPALVEVLVNLVLNGAQAIPDDQPLARVVVSAREHDGRVSIVVTDNGSGIPDDVRRRLFEPFFTTKPFGQATGLGLSVSLGLVRSMGGELTVESVPGRTSMTVTLAAAVQRRVEAVDPSARVVRPRLLVVDDHCGVRNALRRSLCGSFDVTTASGVDEAMERIGKTRFDVVLSDWQMPDGGGRRLVELLAVAHPDVARRLILVSGGDRSPEDCAWLDEMEVQMLGKPLSTEELLAAISRITRDGASAPQSVARASGLL